MGDSSHGNQADSTPSRTINALLERNAPLRLRLLSPATTVLALLSACALAGSTPDPAPDESWHRIQKSGVIIEYQGGLAHLATQLMPEAEKRAKRSKLTECEKAVQRLRTKKAQILSFIAHQIAIEKPTREMEVKFEAWARAVTRVPSTRHIQLWHKAALVNAATHGAGDSPAVKYDPNKRSFSVWSVRYIFQKNVGSLEYIISDPDPLCIPVDDPLTSDSLRRALAFIDTHLNGFSANRIAHTFFHEVAEGSLVATGIRGCFTRWLSDGLADYAADLCLERFCGKQAFRDYVAYANEAQYAELRDQVDLRGWRMMAWQIGMPTQPDGRIESACYAFAGQEIHGLARRHGADIIPAIFREIAHSKLREDAQLVTAVSRATGEDFGAVLGTYGSKNPDEFSGLAVRDLRFGSYTRNGDDYAVAPVADGAQVPLVADGKHGICIEFRHSALSYPVACQAVLQGEREFKIDCDLEAAPSDPSSPITVMAMMRLTFDFKQIRLGPGDYRLRLLLRGKLFKEMALRVASETGAGSAAK